MKEGRQVIEMLMEGFHKGEAKGRFPITYHLTQLEIPAATYFC